MKDLTITEGFSLISLNGLDSRHPSVAKNAALRCIVAAPLLDAYLSGEETLQTVIEQLHQKIKLNYFSRKKLEESIRTHMFGMDLLDEIPDLLGCDYLYYSASVTMKEYHSDAETYLRLTESIKAEALEDGVPSQETLCYLWLLRESGCMHDLFSDDEQKILSGKMGDYSLADELAKYLFPITIHNTMEQMSKQYLHFKRKMFESPEMQGVAFVFPFLERRQAIFIDTEKYGANAMERLIDVITRVESHGHTTKIVNTDGIAVLKIDNQYYQLMPYAVVGRMPVYGVRLVQCIPTWNEWRIV